MKNSFYKFLFTLLPVILIFSCTKESDTLTTTTSNPPPVQSTDTYIISGLVKDTLNQPIGGASLKAYFDDLEIETMSDMDGNYEFEIPKSKTGGYIVAAKEQYNRSIKSIQQTSNSIAKNIFLINNQEISSENLKLELDSLLIIRGRTVTEMGQPIEGSKALFQGMTNINMTLGLTFGHDETDEHGDFEIIVENKDYASKLVRTAFSGTCWKGFAKPILDDEPIVELGDFVLKQETLKQFSTNTSISNCSSPDATSILYFLDDLHLSLYNEPLGNLSMEYCTDSNQSDMLYIGVQNEDKTEFNGTLQAIGQAQGITNNFDLCAPGDHFLEIVMDGDTITETNLNYDESTGILLSPTLGERNYFFSFSGVGGGSLQIAGEIVIRYRKIDFLTCLDRNAEPIFEFDSNFPSFINLIESTSDVVSGVAFGKIKVAADGSLQDAKIRFRIIK